MSAQVPAPSINEKRHTYVAILLCWHVYVLVLTEELIEGCSATEDSLQVSRGHLHEACRIRGRWQAYLGGMLLGSPAVVAAVLQALYFLPSSLDKSVCLETP